MNTRVVLERSLDVGRVLLVLAVLLFHIYLAYPSSALVPGMKLLVGKHIGTCQLPSLPGTCAPAALSFLLQGSALRLVAYNGSAVDSVALVPKDITFSADIR